MAWGCFLIFRQGENHFLAIKSVICRERGADGAVCLLVRQAGPRIVKFAVRVLPGAEPKSPSARFYMFLFWMRFLPKKEKALAQVRMLECRYPPTCRHISENEFSTAEPRFVENRSERFLKGPKEHLLDPVFN
ncbi:hypothetical protein X474_27410 [Dethiosulfatarculus sandiegensis]|uniref:Uncharacterized protein n=1 Tax=Dethiosulfatarculus sandiegensis TaxID=1429043 RepID=A0A0D2G7Y5_9BACT|nr:hypothetical protein X474_27410 [Dethiosulfatarculus sandiegensis]